MKPHLRLVFLSIVLLAVAACGGGRGGHPPGIPRQFGDSDPWNWTGRGVPSSYEVHGIDVSRYQGDISWGRVASSGVRFAFIKSTEGGDIADPMFATNWNGAAAAGIPRGGYHFYYFCRTGAEQAAWFIRNTPRQPGALPPVLDMEWTRSRNCPKRPDADTVRAEMASYLAIVGQHYGQRPIIYTTVDFWEENQLWRLGGYDFWLRSVAGHPRDTYEGHHWTFWQYTGTGRVPGVDGDVDLNAFEGGEGTWQAWLASRRQY